MSQYVTKDSGEVVALRACGFNAVETREQPNTDGGITSFWTFDDSPERCDITAAYFSQAHRPDISHINITDEELAELCFHILRVRKGVFRDIRR